LEIFTGKRVKPWDTDLESMKDFKKGDPVENYCYDTKISV